MEAFVSSHFVLISIIIYIILIFIVVRNKPHLFYNEDGSLKAFGVGYKNKTILPIWLFFILLGILCYLFVLYYHAWLRFS